MIHIGVGFDLEVCQWLCDFLGRGNPQFGGF
jgi:hypothetical protein